MTRENSGIMRFTYFVTGRFETLARGSGGGSRAENYREAKS